jgi:arginine decarboxylase
MKEAQAHFGVLFIDNCPEQNASLVSALHDLSIKTMTSPYNENYINLENFIFSELSCVVISFDDQKKAEAAVHAIRKKTNKLPILMLTAKKHHQKIPLDLFEKIQGVVWRKEDTPAFIAGRIEQEVKTYLENLSPPFFKALLKFSEDYKYSWHTPGHSGGIAFLKSPSGRMFYDFMGENVLRSDLSCSVAELGSLLEHSGPIKDAEENSAKTFGAERTFYVTNGTSTANKIAWQSFVNYGDTVVVDRNCHKSLLHTMILTGAKPLYFKPQRNAYGIIGPIPIKEYKIESLEAKKSTMHGKHIKIATVTNNTYDGVCYNVNVIKHKLNHCLDYLHFDEAWFSYAKFHPMFDQCYGMSPHPKEKTLPTVLATQSTHKLLAALSQASMVHCKSGKKPVNYEHFNEGYMMHTSTSPQYGIIASLDVASKMMQGKEGFNLIDEAIEESLIFRQTMSKINAHHNKKKTWWLAPWQPTSYMHNKKRTLFQNMPISELKKQSAWRLHSKDKWHGFDKIDKDYVMLDPTRTTLLCPGLDENGKFEKMGIPASLFSRFLENRGMVMEKTGFYSFLILFSIGITKGKASALISELYEFKRLYDKNTALEELFPELMADYPERYEGMGIKDLATEMHEAYKAEKITHVLKDVYEVLPKQATSPAQAFQSLVNDNVTSTPLTKLKGRTSAVMLVPYPPGIPIIMPGEVISQPIIEFLQAYEDFYSAFPGFETEVHGLVVKHSGGKAKFFVDVVKA